jgi:hypothetical protein
MIKIEVKKLPTNSDPIKAFEIDGLNALAEMTAEQLRKDAKSIKCEIHPNDTSVITVTVSRTNTKIEYTKICCDNIKSKLKI